MHGPGKWTTNPDAAYDFHFIDRAVHYVETWELKEVELAFAFEDTHSVTTASLQSSVLRYAA